MKRTAIVILTIILGFILISCTKNTGSQKELWIKKSDIVNSILIYEDK